MASLLAVAVVGVAGFVAGFAFGVLYLKRKIENKVAGMMDFAGAEEVLD